MTERKEVSSFEGQDRIKPQAIEAELMRIWRKAAEGDQLKEASAEARVRSTLSNIVVLSRKGFVDSTRRFAGELITELCISHPSRFLIVEYDQADVEPTRVSVFSRCVLAQSGKHVCSEEVYFSVNAQGAAGIPNLIMSLLVPQVPVVLIGLLDFGKEQDEEKPLESGIGILELFSRLSSFSDRVCYDSFLFEDYLASVGVFREKTCCCAKETLGVTCDAFSGNGRDFSWQRVRRWRYLIAEQFDSSLCRDPLVDIRSIELTSENGDSGLNAKLNSPEALLVAGWIADKLNWKFVRFKRDSVSNNGFAIFQNSVEQEVRIEFKERKTPEMGAYSKALKEVVFVVQDLNHQLVEIRITRAFLSASANIQIRSLSEVQQKTLCEFSLRRVTFPPQPLDQLVLAELNSGARSRNFGPAFKQATTLASF